MIKLTIEVDTGDGPQRVGTTVYAWSQLERRTHSKASRLAQDGLGVEDIAYLAYESSRAARIVVPAVFDDYLKRIVHLELVDEEASHPTQAAPSDEN